MQVIAYNPTNDPITPRSPVGAYVKDVVLQHDVYNFLIRSGHVFPILVNPIDELVAKVGFRKEERVDRSDRILNIPMPPQHDECEYAVPLNRTAEAVRKTRIMVEKDHLKMNVPLEIRFVAQDDNMISPTHGRPGCHIGAYTYGSDFSKTYFDEFEALMKTMDGRPHWGKRVTITAAEAKAMFPKYDRFVELRHQLDPKNTFANEFIARVFA